MKKNIIKVALVAVVGLVAGINVFNAQNSDVMSDIALANVEALAQREVVPGYTGPAETYDCFNIFGNVIGKGIMCKSDNSNPCSVITCP